MEDDETRDDWGLPDARLMTEQERQELCNILFNALLEIRMLGYEGKAEQAADVAHAFHFTRYNGAPVTQIDQVNCCGMISTLENRHGLKRTHYN
jgi:hypothetical protein